MPEVIHGKTIELQADPGLADGVTLEITIRPLSASDGEAKIVAIRRTSGSLAHLLQEDWDALDSIVRERQGAGHHRTVAE